MNRSIRRTLLLTYALILALVIVGFGGLVFAYFRLSVHERVDGGLRAHALALAGTLEWEEHEGFDLELTAEYLRRTPELRSEHLGFRIEGPRGELLLDYEPPDGADGPTREALVAGPHDSRVRVYVGTDDMNRELSAFLVAVILIGTAVLAAATQGARVLTGRLLAPIHRMTATAESISSANLSERIDVGRTESELGRLAGTLNEAFDRLQAAFERQARFTAAASHELRTPLSVLVSNSELGLRRDRSPEEYRVALAKCLRAGERMAGVVEGLLVLARADAGGGGIAREPVDLEPLLREAVADLAPQAEKTEIEVTIDAGPVTVPGDAGRLRDLVTNLVSNAIRYNRTGGRVTVTAATVDGEAVLSVADNGVGIPEAARARVFERFYRVDPARSREVGGSGLGLAIARWIVDAHGGRIDLASEEGVGTTVTVRLPVSDDTRGS